MAEEAQSKLQEHPVTGWQPPRYDPRAHRQRMSSPPRDDGHPPRQPEPRGRWYAPGEYPEDPPVAWQPYPPRRSPSTPLQPRPKSGSLGIFLAFCGLAVVLGGGIYMLRGAGTPQTCAQQYAAWKNGPARSGVEAIQSAGAQLSTAGNNEDITAMDQAYETVGRDAAALQSQPIPACADPAGYWPQILDRFKAAGDNAASTPGLGGLLLAEAPLKPVSGLESELRSELTRTTAAPASS